MTIERAHADPHYVTRAGWLRAAVLGANDGIVSISALLVGVAAADPGAQAVALAGVAGLVAGALSMAAGEYVSVSSQSDIERADIARERVSLHKNASAEEAELASIYRARGLSDETAAQVARELTDHDALDAHIRDELGLSEVHKANPLQAAFTSAATFSIAGAIPLLAALFAPGGAIIPSVVVATLAALAVLGAVGARAGGAPAGRAVRRVVFWGLAALALTAGVGKLFGVAV
ncbi:MAG: hypothetical protein CSA72_11300 [Rhodobacterales bacterium]|nr:MAG: hypothetical protein CSA72_11300 [Rhodobacterales bacterium]